MDQPISRRKLAAGAAWAAPAVVAASSVPAMAWSICGDIKSNVPLPAAAFRLNYLAVTNQTFGGAASKALSIIAGVSLNPAYLPCVGSAALTLANSSTNSSITLTNGNTYVVTSGNEGSGSGTTGVRNPDCSGGDNLAQACITAVSVSVLNSTGTSSYNPRTLSFAQKITVAGFGTTSVFLNASSFSLSGTTWNGSGLSITS